MIGGDTMMKSMLRFILLACLLTVSVIAHPQDLDRLTHLQPGRPLRSSSGNADWQNSNVDYRFIRPRETLTLADFKGPGSVRRIWMTVLPSEPGYSRLLTLRIFWDGEKLPSVECPIGDFFGVGHGVDVAMNSLPVRVSAEGRARSCYWAMPFRKSARITVTNDGTQATWGFYYNIDGEQAPVAAAAPYFHASYRQAFPCGPGNYVIAQIKGRGHYVGTVLSARTLSAGWFGEGDEFMYVDGEKIPSIRGTGYEDYFGEAWALRKTDGAYNGCSVWEGGNPGARSTCYRWHIPDPVRFSTGLKVEIQHKGVGTGPDGKESNNVERDDEYASVAFWYQTGPHLPYPPLPSGMDRLPFDYRRLVEIETLSLSNPSSGTITTESVPGLHGGKLVEWANAQPLGELKIPFTVDKAGINQLVLLTTHRWDGGQVQLLIDGSPRGDTYSFRDGGCVMNQEWALPLSTLTAGAHTLTLRCVSPGWFGLDGLLVQPKRAAK